MPRVRTNVYADSEDLEIIKDAARRRGVPEAEIIREAIKLAALNSRHWSEPLDLPAFEGPGTPVTKDDVRAAVADGYDRSVS